MPTPKVGAATTSLMFFRRARARLWMGLVMRIGKERFTVDSRQSTVSFKHMASGHNSSAGLSNARNYQFIRRNRRRLASGFTLLELMIVMTLIMILASMVTPTYRIAIVRAREAVLRDDLYTLRTLIDQYTLDKQHPPATLQDLVDDGYLHGALPEDPFTRSNDTWH